METIFKRSEKFNRATRLLALDHSYFATIFAAKPLVMTLKTKTASTDGVRIYVNPAYVESIPVSEIVGTLIHECYHIGLDHPLRLKLIAKRMGWKLDRRLIRAANEVMDSQINHLLAGDKIRLSSGTILNGHRLDYALRKYCTMTFEAAIADWFDPDEENESEDGEDGEECEDGEDGESGTGDSGKSEDQDEDESEESEDEDGESGGSEDGEDESEDGESTSSESGDEDEDGESGDPGEAYLDEDEDQDCLPLPDGEDEDKHRRDTESLVRQAVENANQCGNCPKSGSTMIKVFEDSRVNWRDRLVSVTPGGLEDWAYSKPNFQYWGSSFVMPAITTEGAGTCLVALDASGSVNDRSFALAAPEVNGIARQANPEALKVLQFAEEIIDVQDVDPASGIESIVRKSYGGTCFQPIFDWVEENQIVPDWLIIITDMEAPFPKVAPDYPVIWLAVPNRSDYFGDPDFGEVVQMHFE
jgi:predicted metal-dependent peptidase